MRLSDILSLMAKFEEWEEQAKSGNASVPTKVTFHSHGWTFTHVGALTARRDGTPQPGEADAASAMSSWGPVDASTGLPQEV